MADQNNLEPVNKFISSVVFKVGVPYYVVNNQVPGVKMDVAPFIQDGRTFVPVRYLGVALGVPDSNITYQSFAKQVYIMVLHDPRVGDRIFNMTIGKKHITGVPNSVEMDVAPILQDPPGRVFLPARYVAEYLDYHVDWDEENKVVICWPFNSSKPDVKSAIDYLNSL